MTNSLHRRQADKWVHRHLQYLTFSGKYRQPFWDGLNQLLWEIDHVAQKVQWLIYKLQRNSIYFYNLNGVWSFPWLLRPAEQGIITGDAIKRMQMSYFNKSQRSILPSFYSTFYKTTDWCLNNSFIYVKLLDLVFFTEWLAASRPPRDATLTDFQKLCDFFSVYKTSIMTSSRTLWKGTD